MITGNTIEIPEDIKAVLKDTVSSDPMVAHAATEQLKAAFVAAPIKSGIFYGDIVTGIFFMEGFEPGTPIEYGLDAIGPADVKYHIAYTMNAEGYVPQRTIEGDYLAMKTYIIRASMDWSREMARYARWPVVARSMQAFDAALVRKRNNDGWHTLITAAVDRGVSISDTSAASGLFGKRVVALAQTVMRRNAGGNSTSLNRGKLTHIALSPESLQDIRSWDVTQVDEITRREIFLAGDDVKALTRIFGVTLIDIDELGEGQEYQNYYTTTLAASIPNSKAEVALGLDLSNPQESFVMPWVKRENGQSVQLWDDPVLTRIGRQGFFGEHRMGVSVLDNRKLIIIGV